ncbi:MAG TPA: SiaC family regulatory phosphoprotein [Bacteroidales bacterium]|jgi:hypothetical protein|nr:SiaC family regulatory phosphoprotein [Bacteroidales bacterium]MDY0160281.1 SiaC family regulatory phosphoprotein [Bacteroidales bacterium]MDY0324494.1 SiaC family regulatory phosphoprotein [Candidatus Carbobacillus sp.]HXK82154.1 SiaC family regulatory phosphoprotein [Bacteroidales bacterium]
MVSTILNKTETTAEVKFDSNNCKIEINGIFIPENPVQIFNELKQKTFEIFKKCNNPQLHIVLDYFNTASAKHLLEYLQASIKEFSIDIFWYYQNDDEDILEAGKDYEYLIGQEFTFIIL